MEELARNRQDLAEKWNVGNKSGIMYMKASIPKVLSPIKLGILNIFVPTLLLALLYTATSFIIPNVIDSKFLKFISYCVSIGALVLLIFFAIRTIILSVPRLFIPYIAKKIKSALEINELITTGGKLKFKTNKTKKTIDIVAVMDNIKEQKVVLDTIGEFFSPINEPRYVLIKTFCKIKLYHFSYQIPGLLSPNKETVDVLKKELKILHPFELVYTNTPSKVKIILKCKKRSYIRVNGPKITQKQTS